MVIIGHPEETNRGCHAGSVLKYGEYQGDMTLIDDKGRQWRRVRDWVEPSEAVQFVADGMPYLVQWCGTAEPRHERRERFKSDILRPMVTREKADKVPAPRIAGLRRARSKARTSKRVRQPPAVHASRLLMKRFASGGPGTSG